MSETRESPGPNEPERPHVALIVDPVSDAAILASIRLEYLKLAIIVVLIMVIVWYLYCKMSRTRTSTGTDEPVTDAFRVVRGVPMHTSPSTKAPSKKASYADTTENFAPYASWLTPDIYRSDPAHDEHIASKQHYGMYAPLDLNYLFPSNIELPQHKGTPGSAQEHLIAYNQHIADTDEVASETEVPERQLEAEAGLLFGLSNQSDVPIAQDGVL